MKKFLLVVGLFVLAMIALASILPLIMFAFGAVLIYFAVKSFKRTDSTFGKIFWVFTGLIGLSIVFHTVPVLIGIIALIAIIHLVKGWKHEKHYKVAPEVGTNSNFGYDDFRNFESEWESVMKKYK